MKMFMNTSFKLLCVDNDSKDLFVEINFLVWRPYLSRVCMAKRCNSHAYLHYTYEIDFYVARAKQSHCEGQRID